MLIAKYFVTDCHIFPCSKNTSNSFYFVSFFLPFMFCHKLNWMAIGGIWPQTKWNEFHILLTIDVHVCLFIKISLKAFFLKKSKL